MQKFGAKTLEYYCIFSNERCGFDSKTQIFSSLQENTKIQ